MMMEGQNSGTRQELACDSSGRLIAGGGAAHDAVAAGNPVLEGGYASAAAPSDVSADGDAVRAWNLRNGARATVITAAGALIGGDATNGLDVDVTRIAALAAATTNVHAPAPNTAAVIPYSAGGANVKHVITGIAWSYSAAPTSGNLKIEDGSGTTVFSVDVTAAGPGFIPFNPPLKGTSNTALIITLAAGGSGVSGKVNVLGKTTE